MILKCLLVCPYWVMSLPLCFLIAVSVSLSDPQVRPADSDCYTQEEPKSLSPHQCLPRLFHRRALPIGLSPIFSFTSSFWFLSCGCSFLSLSGKHYLFSKQNLPWSCLHEESRVTLHAVWFCQRKPSLAAYFTV